VLQNVKLSGEGVARSCHYELNVLLRTLIFNLFTLLFHSVLVLEHVFGQIFKKWDHQ